MSILVILALFVTFVADTFQRQEGVQSIREDSLLTIIAIAYGRPEEFIILTRYSEQMRENVKDLICGKNDVIITTNFIYNKIRLIVPAEK